jgi:hypothetical protein
MTFRALLVLLLLGISVQANAASVTLVKGTRALINLSGGLEDAKVGDEIYSVDANGKRKALLKLRQVKGQKAVADIVKGVPAIGHDVTPRVAAGAGAGGTISREVREDDIRAQQAASGEGDDYYKRLRKASKTGKGYGLLAGLQQTTMNVDFTAGAGASQRTVSVAMKGSSFGILGYYDYPIIPALQFRGLAGIEQMNAAGSIDTSDCDGGTEYTFAVNYLSLYGQAKFNYLDNGSTRGWVSGGFGFLLALSKASNVLNTSQISTNQVYLASLGFDFSIGRNMCIPVALEYGMHPASDTVKVSVMTVRSGIGWAF